MGKSIKMGHIHLYSMVDVLTHYCWSPRDSIINLPITVYGQLAKTDQARVFRALGF